MRYLKALVWTSIIFLLSFMSGEKIPSHNFFDIIHADKIAHFIMYFVQCVLLISVNKEKQVSKLKKYLPAILLGLATSLITEFGQKFLSQHRTGDIYDFIANVSGIIVGCVCFNILYNQLKKYKLDFIV